MRGLIFHITRSECDYIPALMPCLYSYITIISFIIIEEGPFNLWGRVCFFYPKQEFFFTHENNIRFFFMKKSVFFFQT